MTITRDILKNTATLARLKFSEEELARFTDQMAAIITYVEKLNELDIAGVEPTAHALESATPLRPDEAKPFPEPAKIVEESPHRDGSFYQVPKIIP